ncbi:MAG: tetratricopeptide repeat protein [Deinococcota bacterium]
MICKLALLLTSLYILSLQITHAQRIVFDEPTSIEGLLADARDIAEQARQRYAGTEYNYDQPLWQDALERADQARQLDPDNLEVLAFLADTYNTISWDARTREYWLRYLEVGGEQTDVVRTQLTSALNELGFARYQTEDYNGALEYYLESFIFNPDADTALLYLARIHFELGELGASLPYWQEAASRRLEGAQYFLTRTEQRLAVGVLASDSFYSGLEAYQAGQLEAALEHFQAATSSYDSFKDAWVWRARTALELGRAETSLASWQRVIDLDPSDERAQYFVSVAERQVAWGASAARAFEEGITLYNQGDLSAAASAFAEAVNANSNYQEARVWRARSLQEAGSFEAAVAAWEEVIARDPDDERARYFLNLARSQLNSSQLNIGEGAGSALATGISSYETRDLEAAEASFNEVVRLNPDAAAGWGWLGRIAFDRSNYALAAEHYDRALELAPDDNSYQFFAGEAARLAAELADADTP